MLSNKLKDSLRKVISDEQRRNIIPDALCFGKIENVNPLCILVNGKLPLYSENLIIPSDVLEHTEKVYARTSTNGEHSHNHTVTEITFPSQLEIGKFVVLYGLQYREISKSYQKYILMKVV